MWTVSWAGCSTWPPLGADRGSPSSAPTTVRRTARTATSVTGSRRRPCGPCPTRSSSCRPRSRHRWRRRMLDGSPYQGYLYAYPHKTAYRPLGPRPALRDVWAGERRDALFLYLHVPFCEMRCGFCNLFTRANPPAEQVRRYLRQVRAAAGAVRDALGPATFATTAIGGGTPTYLTAPELAEIFSIVDTMTGSPVGP